MSGFGIQINRKNGLMGVFPDLSDHFHFEGFGQKPDKLLGVPN